MNKCRRKMDHKTHKLIIIIILFPITAFLHAQQDAWITHYEKSGFTETQSYEETIGFCQRLARHSPLVHFTTFGVSLQGRDLPLLIIDKDQHFTSGETKKTILLLQANIHPGEPDGNDAGLTLIRDMIIHGQHAALLENITLLFIPSFNVDGHKRFGPYNRINQNGPKETGWRTNAQNLNLNRDHIKADAPEMQAWLRLFNEWKPHFFVDCHTTNGADYQYPLTYMLETFGNMDEQLTNWQTNIYEPLVIKKMEDSGIPIFRYVQFRRWHDPRSGLKSAAAPGMLSQGYTALLNRPGLLIETHMLKDYKTRVDATYKMILHTMQILDEQGEELKNLVINADKYASSAAFREKLFPLGFTISDTDSVMVEFLGVEYDIDVSPIKGGPWFRYHPDQPATFTLPLFNHNIPTHSVKLPEAYIVPVAWTEVIQRIKAHGISFSRITETLHLEVESYRFENPVWRNTPNEGRQTVTADAIPVLSERVFEPGSLIIPMDQPAARLIASMLEPASNDSFLYWGFFNAIFEQKEYAETYIMEPLAQEMLEKNLSLRRQFEDMKTNNPGFAENQWAMLNWFYRETPYWDQHKNIYPVARIADSELLPEPGILFNEQ
jgi:hypothetical protein